MTKPWHTSRCCFVVLACLVTACSPSNDATVQQPSSPQVGATTGSNSFAFEQPRLKLTLTAPSNSTTTRAEKSAYDEVKVTLANKAGELTIWTYSRRFHSGIELVLAQRTSEFEGGQLEARTIGPLPALLLRRAMQNAAGTFVTRAVIDRPGFDWIYVLEAEAPTNVAHESLMAIIESIRPLDAPPPTG